MCLKQLVVGAALTAAIGHAALAAEPLKIGLVLPMSGPFAAYGKQMEHGVKVYLATNGGSVGARTHLDQVLFLIGLVFVAMSSAHFLFGAQQQPLQLPPMLSGQFYLPGGLDVGAYRLFLIVVGLALAFGLQWMIAGTKFGGPLRVSLDNPRAARGMGIDVDRVFVLTFALGAGLAGLGGALGTGMLGLDPAFPVKTTVCFLIVAAAGGSDNLKGPLIASLILGIGDVAGQYHLPQVGAFVICAVMVATLICRPQGLFGRTAAR